jgi:SulP family sulfate permease
MGIMRMGRLIQYVPDPVVTGFTAGIAVVIATFQLKDLLGLNYAERPEHYWEHWSALATSLPGISWPELGVAAFTMLLLLLWPRLVPAVPAPLPALLLASLVSAALSRYGLEVHTIGNTFNYIQDGRELWGIPALAPAFIWPWHGWSG